jgi:chromosome segregation ATPase
MAGVRDLVQERLQQLQASVSSAVSSQGQHSAAVRADLAAFKDQKDRDIQQLQQQVAGVQSTVQQLQQAVLERIQSAAEAAASTLSGVDAQTNTFARQACDGVAAAHAATTAAVGSLVAVLEAQTQQLSQYAQRHSSAAEEALAGVRELGAAVKTQFSGGCSACGVVGHLDRPCCLAECRPAPQLCVPELADSFPIYLMVVLRGQVAQGLVCFFLLRVP